MKAIFRRVFCIPKKTILLNLLYGGLLGVYCFYFLQREEMPKSLLYAALAFSICALIVYLCKGKPIGRDPALSFWSCIGLFLCGVVLFTVDPWYRNKIGCDVILFFGGVMLAISLFLLWREEKKARDPQ